MTRRVVIADSSASRFHAELRREADGYVIADRGSSNGTLLNGAIITTHHLRPGDEIIDLANRKTADRPRARAVRCRVTP